jgi:pyrrolidone-carboxylate peptidase
VWSPPGARTVRISAADPDILAATLGDHLKSGDCRAVLLVGRTHKGGGFRMQMRAENRTLDRKDRLSETGPGVARTTAPVADIVRALNAAGLSADASSEAEEDVGSYLLYRILADLPEGPHTPAIGLLRAPAPADEAVVKKGVKAAASVMAGHMALLPRN